MRIIWHSSGGHRQHLRRCSKYRSGLPGYLALQLSRHVTNRLSLYRTHIPILAICSIRCNRFSHCFFHVFIFVAELSANRGAPSWFLLSRNESKEMRATPTQLWTGAIANEDRGFSEHMRRNYFQSLSLFSFTYFLMLIILAMLPISFSIIFFDIFNYFDIFITILFKWDMIIIIMIN